MTLAILAYALAGGAVVAAGSWALATVVRMAAQPERWVWAAGMAAAVLLTAAPFLSSIQGDSESAAPAGEFRITERPTPPSAEARPTTGAWPPLWARVDGSARIPLAGVAWFVLSGALLLAVAGAELRHRRRSGALRRVRLHGVDAWESPDQGPAVWGALTPRLVVPERIGELSPDDQRLVLVHETEHLRARDPQLNAFVALAIALVPWNPFLWVMARRLARALESDCDRRTLERSRAEPHAYAKLLLRVAAWQTRPAAPPLALAMGRPARELRGRLERVLHPRPPRYAGVLAAVLLVAVGASAPLFADPPDVAQSTLRRGVEATRTISRQPTISEGAARPANEPAGAVFRAREVPAAALVLGPAPDGIAPVEGYGAFSVTFGPDGSVQTTAVDASRGGERFEAAARAWLDGARTNGPAGPAHVWVSITDEGDWTASLARSGLMLREGRSMPRDELLELVGAWARSETAAPGASARYQGGQ